MIAARADLMALPVADRRAVLADPSRLAAAGMTWESLAGWLQGPLDATAWQAVIGSMGYMALLLACATSTTPGVPDDVAEQPPAGRSDPGGRVAPVADAVPVGVPGRAVAALGGGTGASAVGIAGVRSLAGRAHAGAGRPVRVDVRTGLGAVRAEPGRRGLVFGVALAVRAQAADLVQFGTDCAPVRSGAANRAPGDRPVRLPRRAPHRRGGAAPTTAVTTGSSSSPTSRPGSTLAGRTRLARCRPPFRSTPGTWPATGMGTVRPGPACGTLRRAHRWRVRHDPALELVGDVAGLRPARPVSRRIRVPAPLSALSGQSAQISPASRYSTTTPRPPRSGWRRYRSSDLPPRGPPLQTVGGMPVCSWPSSITVRRRAPVGRPI